MYNPKELLTKEPAVIAGSVAVVLNVLVLLGVLDIDSDQIAGINAGTAAVLALFVRQSVTPNAKL